MNESQKYFEQHAEPKQPLQPIPESLTKPMLDNIEFKEGAGKIEIEKNGIHFELAYGRNNEYETNDTLVEFARDPKYREEIGKHENWKTIEKFFVSDLDGNKIINLNSLLKRAAHTDGWGDYWRKLTVVFPVTNDSSISARLGATHVRTVENGGSLIILNSNITSPITLITLLHELGHNQRPATKDEHEIEKLSRFKRYLITLNKKLLTDEEKNDPHLDEKIAQFTIEEERDAWAYALNKMRPLIRKGFFKKEDVISFMHENALQSYSNLFRTFIDPTLKEKVLASIMGVLNTFFDKEILRRNV